MLGDKIGEERGKVTTRRVLEGDDYRYVKMEVCFEASLTILGLKGADMGTYTVFERIPGQLYGEGRGIVITDSGESAIWNGHGVGAATGKGLGMKFAASVAFQAPATGKLARLNNVLVLVEHVVKADGSARSTLHEWKV
ncbi:MAG TPA: hypothetical protein VIE44_15280 [Methylomirabilota bacterium]|jgi:hypothetical protein